MDHRGKYLKKSSPGFTLVEMLVVSCIMVIVMAAVYALFYRSQRVYADQDQVVARKQAASSAVEMISRELAMAGFDPDHNRLARAGFVKTPQIPTETPDNKLRFTMDLDGNGTFTGEEDVRYYLYTDPADHIQKLGRETPDAANPSKSTRVPVAENISEFEMTYFVVADGTFRSLAVNTTKSDCVARAAAAGDLAKFPSPDPLLDPCLTGGQQDIRDGIRRVRVKLTAQIPRPDPAFKGSPTYTLTADVALRNLNYLQ